MSAMDETVTAHRDRFILDRLPPSHLRPEKIHGRPDLRLPPRLNAAQWLLMQGRETAGEGPAVTAPAGAWSYSGIEAAVDRMARRLVDGFGIVPGNRVLLVGANSPSLLVGILASLKAGAIAVPALPLLRARELAVILTTARPQLALADGAVTAAVEAACRRAAQAVPIATFDDLAAPSRMGDAGSGENAGAVDFTACATAADDPALILFSSGTTGRPKAAVHGHGDIVSIALTFGRHIFRARPGDIVLGTPSLAFAYGFGALLAFPLAAGAAVHLDPAMRAADLVETARRAGASMLVSAPTAYRRLLAEETPLDLPTLRRCFSAGERLPQAVAAAWEERTGVKIIDLLGSTEMLGPYVSAPEEAQRPGTIGRAVPGYEVRLVDEHGRAVAAGGLGRLAVRGPTGCLLLDAGDQARAVREGWTLTGDICRLDEDGYVHYESRLDGIIVSAGYNIAASEVEEALSAHPAVADCAVIGAPDPERGRAVVALVVPREGTGPSPALADALRAHVKMTIAPYKAPRRIHFLDALPKTATGKTRRRDLAALVDEDVE